VAGIGVALALPNRTRVPTVYCAASYAVLTSEWEKETVGVEPDRVFGLHGRKGTVSWFMLETDCGTMPVSRRRLRTSSSAARLWAIAKPS
jgi:hypothetical protein